MDEKILAIWLSEALGAGSVFGKRLIGEYGSFREIYALDEKGYERVGINSSSATMARLLDKNTDGAKKCAAFCDSNYFEIIDWNSDMYPGRLKAIKDPPAVLYARGRMTDFDDNVCIAVVGTRSYSDAGWNATYRVASGIASGGAVVVTGLASGIDTAATRAALDSSGFAVGVIGSGPEKIYPSENKELFEEMYVKGLIISEKPPFSEITGRYFPVRNRIISGLCNAVLVGEGSTRSGAMITAAHASEQGRRIFAIPGDISGAESSGVNNLIREGAVPAFEASDVLRDYMYLYPHRIGLDKSISAGDISVPEKRSTKRVRVLNGKSPLVKEIVPKKQKADIPETKPVTFSKVYEGNAVKPDAVKNETEQDGFDIESLEGLEKKIYKYIAAKGKTVSDEICGEVGADMMSVNIALTALEMMGLVETEGPNVKLKR